MKEDEKILSVQVFNQKYDIRVHFLESFGCINVIRTYLREYNLYIEDGDFQEHP